MVLSLLDEIGKRAKDSSAGEIQSYLHSLGITMFDAIYNKTEPVPESEERINKFPDQTPKYIILFILYAYSEESPYLVLGSDAKKEKEAIIQRLQIPELYHNILLNLEDDAVRGAVVEYINQFAPAWWASLQFLKIQHEDMMAMVTRKESVRYDKGKKENVFDPKAHISLSKEVAKLGIEIGKMEDDAKAKYASRYKFLSSMKDELKLQSKKDTSDKGIAWEFGVPDSKNNN